jgi:hypothetical protein
MTIISISTDRIISDQHPMFFGFQAPGGLFIQHTTSHQWCALWPGGLVYTHSVTPFCGAQSVSRYHCFILGKKDIYVACCRFARL